MDILRIFSSFFSVAVLGGVLGIGLAVASKIFAVKKDERVEKVEDALPGVNCGACGYAGCAAYAEAIVNEEADLTLCSPGGAGTASELAGIMGKEVTVSDVKQVAQVFCRGNRKTSKYKFEYRGIEDCNALHMLYEGDKECSFGCLALGSCIRVCPVDAISHDPEGCVWVNRELCITCGKCIEVCPTKVMKYIPYKADYLVACNSTDKGAVVRKYCTVGCIGCRICEKKSPDGGFVVKDFLAVIDYSASGERKNASDSCPAKCIVFSDKPAETFSTEEAGKDEKGVHETA